jgi:hypothetical protein
MPQHIELSVSVQQVIFKETFPQQMHFGMITETLFTYEWVQTWTLPYSTSPSTRPYFETPNSVMDNALCLKYDFLIFININIQQQSI